MEKTMKHLTFLLVLLAGFSLVAEEEMTCKTDLGSCKFTKTSMTCECAPGTYGEGSGIASVSPDGTDNPLPTDEECKAEIKRQCDLPEGAEQCDNPAGKCVVFDDGSYSCQCLDGSGEGSAGTSGGSSGSGETTPSVDPDDDDTLVNDEGDNETDPGEPTEECKTDADCKEGKCVDGVCNFVGEKPVCAEKLVEVCGTEAPKLSDYCSAGGLAYCVDLFGLYSEKCNDNTMTEAEKKELLAGTWNKYGATIADCCRDAKNTDTKKEMDTMKECLETKKCEDCSEQVEPVYGEDDGKSDGADSADNEAGGADQGDSANSSENKEVPDGCSALII